MTEVQKQNRDRYIFLLERLNIIFENDPEFIKFRITDFNDYRQIKNAIPLYSKKLMELSIYYRKQREYIKSATYRNSLYGSKLYTSHMLYNYFKEITQLDDTQNLVLKKCLNEIKQNSNIEDPNFWTPELEDEYYIM